MGRPPHLKSFADELAGAYCVVYGIVNYNLLSFTLTH